MPVKAKEKARGVEKSPSVWARALKPKQEWSNKVKAYPTSGGNHSLFCWAVGDSTSKACQRYAS